MHPVPKDYPLPQACLFPLLSDLWNLPLQLLSEKPDQTEVLQVHHWLFPVRSLVPKYLRLRCLCCFHCSCHLHHFRQKHKHHLYPQSHHFPYPFQSLPRLRKNCCHHLSHLKYPTQNRKYPLKNQPVTASEAPAVSNLHRLPLPVLLQSQPDFSHCLPHSMPVYFLPNYPSAMQKMPSGT